MIKKKYFAAAFALLGLAVLSGILLCPENDPSEKKPENPAVSDFSPRYAGNFRIEKKENFRILNVKNALSEDGAPLQWLLIDSSQTQTPVPASLALIPRVQVPLKRSAILSTTYLGYMKALGVTEHIAAVGDARYIADSLFFERVARGEVAEVGSGPSLSVEKLYRARAEAVLTFATGSSVNDDLTHLKKWSHPVILTAEWKEKSPLAKAEWLYFFGALYGKEALADSLFKECERRYLELQAKVKNLASERKPRVIAGAPSFGIWFAPPEDSYTGALIRDAGGEYLFQKSSGTLSFEEALVLGAEAEVWLHPGGWKTRQEGEMQEKRVVHFKAWRENEVFQYDLKQGPRGGLDYFESAVVSPEKVLQDAAKILYPALFTENDFEWYRKLAKLGDL
ncbi:MAG: ABC transporter substrate-binding protein [Fibrobacter sp.]|jgi:iron complex transport system substrate-binding protein|nr:ABC transporter substrate-binding protein [Fibrobacter sp.]